MTVQEAEKIQMPFGKYKGKSLGAIADEDVLYLDWLLGETIKWETLRTAIGVICEDRVDEIRRKTEE